MFRYVEDFTPWHDPTPGCLLEGQPSKLWTLEVPGGRGWHRFGRYSPLDYFAMENHHF